MTTELTREQKLNLIYRHTHRDYKGKLAGERSILVLRQATTLVQLKDLTDAEITYKLPYALRQEEKRKGQARQQVTFP